MKILEKKEIKPWSLEKRCPNCDSLLLIEKQDLKYCSDLIRNETYGDHWDYHFEFECPVCKEEASIIRSEVPEKVKILIAKRSRN